MSMLMAVMGESSTAVTVFDCSGRKGRERGCGRVGSSSGRG